MKWITSIFRVFVGTLFIFSGLIKINDPVGFSIKLSEYFEVFSNDFAGIFHYFIPFSLTIAVIVCLFEIVLGINLLTKHGAKITINLTLLLIVFFTFLTFYSAYFNKVTDCGCFGDAIPLNPWQSFIKDIVLLIMILWLYFRKNELEPNLPERTRNAFFAISLVISFFLAVIAIRHLPFLDFRAYKVGTNIEKAMQPSEPLKYKYIMEKDGEQVEMMEYPSDPSFKYVDMVLVNPEAQPKITDYSIWNDEGDYTEETFRGRKMMIIISDINKTKTKNYKKLKDLAPELPNLNIQTMIITSSDGQEVKNTFTELGLPDIPVYYGDATVLKTMIRSNPGLILIEEGTILEKWHFRDTPSKNKLAKVIG
ncbi:DoxX family protein [Hyphobacterium sp. CCMP332]|nr:DoxX family protein [Hyphobacterium sp. CCMP332]